MLIGTKLVGTESKKIDLIDGSKAYSKLSGIINEEGVLKRDYIYYTFLSIVAFGGFFLSLFLIIVANSLSAIVLFSSIFAFFSVQVAGLIHDCGHRAIFKSSKYNDYFGHICSAVVAIPYTNWKIRHNKHHASPNEEDADPDINFPFISFTTDRYRRKKGLEKILSKYQAYIYFPILTLTVFIERNFIFLFSKKSRKNLKTLEKTFFLIGVFTWFILPFVIFDPAKAITFFLTSNMLTGFYIANIFAPNHKGMPEIKKGAEISFIEQQIMTTRNIKASWFVDFVYLGLNYQMEHHLFPNCPRNKLKLITPHLKKLCKQMDLEFTETSVLESNKIIISELHSVAKFA